MGLSMDGALCSFPHPMCAEQMCLWRLPIKRRCLLSLKESFSG
jgi:hypothetical protein